MKRLISTLLAIFTVAALICVPVMAEETTNEVLVADTSWYNEDDTVFFIEDAADFLGLAQIYGETGEKFAGKTIELTADIDLNPGWDATVTVDATSKAVTLPATPANVFGGISEFQGTFDGRGHTVKGLYVYGEAAGPFGFIHKGTGDFVFKNTAFVNGLIYASVKSGNTSNEGLGLVGSYNDGAGTMLIENIYSDVNVVCQRNDDLVKYMVAGILGRMNNVKKPSFAFDAENTVDVDGDGTAEPLYWVTEANANVKGCVYAGMIVTMDANKVANKKVLNVSQLVGGTNKQGFAGSTGLADAEPHESNVNYMWDRVTNSVAMGDTTYATNTDNTNENYGEGKIDFYNVIEGAKPQNSTIDETLFKVGAYNTPAKSPAAFYKADLAANAFKWSAEAQAIVPVGVADMLDPNVAAMPNDPSYVPGGSNNEEEEEEEDDDDNGTTVTPPPAETTPVTEAPTTTAPAAEESGCASVASIAVVGVLALAAAPMLLKKKED